MANKFLWLLDNGHGQGTPGKRSPKFEDGSQLFEYEFNRDIVKRLSIKLNAAGISHKALVPEIEGDISLKERVRRANSINSVLPKIFISVHANANGNGTEWDRASGIETYYYAPKQNEKLAKTFQESLAAEVGWKDRGVKTAGFYVIKNTNMPAILTENGFYTNKEECLKMLSDNWKDKIAEAHFKAIKEIERN